MSISFAKYAFVEYHYSLQKKKRKKTKKEKSEATFISTENKFYFPHLTNSAATNALHFRNTD